MLTIAVAKGRIWREALPLLRAAGCAPDESALASRSLIIPTAAEGIRVIIARSRDAPVYVACGAADCGIAGGDVLAENPMDEVCQPLDLRIARCRLAAATASGKIEGGRGKIVVATKYINLAREYFNRRAVAADFIKLHGTMELAPLVGMADAIVDLVDTGDTLRAHGLREAAVLRRLSAMFIVNRAAARKNAPLAQLQRRLADAAAAGGD